jgi:hypothetical protein
MILITLLQMDNFDFDKLLLTEDTFVDWIKENGGVLHTRKCSNINKMELSRCKKNTLVCLTGYTQVVNQFFAHTIKNFTNKIILITLETDFFEMKDKYLNHPLLTHWFTWNKQYEHPRLTCIPIGLNADRHLEAMKTYITERNSMEREELFAVNLSVSTNAERQALVDLAQTDWADFCTFIDNIPFSSIHMQFSYVERQINISVTDPECYRQMSQFKFILSPPGAGLDCHRTWEALYLGTIPIVLSSSIDELFADLPVVIVSSWDVITPEFLEEKYNEVQRNWENKKYDVNKLYFEYWKKMIERQISK